MKRKAELLKSAFALCAFSMLCKACGMLFRLYIASRIGSEGLGLYQLVLSVYTLFASFATAGLQISVSRITAEELETYGNEENGIKALNTSLRLAFLLGTFSALSLLLLSYPLSKVMLGDGRTLIPMRILAFSMPFMSLSSCIKGWFIGSRRIFVPASSQLLEELCKMLLTVTFLTLFCSRTNDMGILCSGVALGLTASEVFSFLYVCLCKKAASAKKTVNVKGLSSVKRIADIAFPIAASSWLTGGLHAVENILIPYCFTLYGGGQSKALSDFGMIRGMVIPMLFFPFAFLSAVISILIPEISRLNVLSDKKHRDGLMEKTLRITGVFSMLIGALFYFFPNEICNAFYHNAEGAESLRMLALVTPFMYIETISDGLLKGIGEQKYSMKITVINCIMRTAAVFLLIPSTGTDGYIKLLLISNTFSFIMCYGRLMKVSTVKIRLFSSLLVPALLSVGSVFAAKYICGILLVGNSELCTAAGMVASAVLYAALNCGVSRVGYGKVV